jgi:uncharacterized protein YndB with AHSA1/START domain
MTNKTAVSAKPVRFERTYEASAQDLWDLWTTKEGFESWWGPEGFRVEVHAIEPRVGGKLSYDMLAVEPAHIEYLKKEGMAASHGTHGTFVEVEPQRRLKILHVIDFIPGLAPYENNILVELFPGETNVRMVVTIDAHPDEEWTRRSAAGFESQLRKLPGALAAKRK